jgi:hypothetical protein
MGQGFDWTHQGSIGGGGMARGGSGEQRRRGRGCANPSEERGNTGKQMMGRARVAPRGEVRGPG